MQSIVDIFFIDWEHEKDIMANVQNQRITKKYKGVWRILFLANQLNQFQTKRKINIEFAFALLALLWYHFDWENQTKNSATLYSPRNSPEVYLMMHFQGTIILIIIGIIIILYKFILNFIYPNSKTVIMDLLSISNLSLFILDSSLHGYYIHGQSPSGKADATFEELLSFLEEEKEGKIKNRNLELGDYNFNNVKNSSSKNSTPQEVTSKGNDNQSYEIYISYRMRKNYDGLFAIQAETMYDTASTKDKMINQSRMTNILKVLPKNFPYKFVLLLKDFMNTELKEKIQKVSNQSNKYILNKTIWQRFLNLPPANLVKEDSEDMLMYRDRNNSFDNILLFGIDWEWYLLNIYTFQMWMLTVDSFAQSIMLTLICDKLLIFIRSWCGLRNLSKKSIINDKFFF